MQKIDYYRVRQQRIRVADVREANLSMRRIPPLLPARSWAGNETKHRKRGRIGPVPGIIKPHLTMAPDSVLGRILRPTKFQFLSTDTETKLLLEDSLDACLHVSIPALDNHFYGGKEWLWKILC